MSHLDDLPKHHSSHQIEDQSKSAFRAAMSECQEFIINPTSATTALIL